MVATSENLIPPLEGLPSARPLVSLDASNQEILRNEEIVQTNDAFLVKYWVAFAALIAVFLSVSLQRSMASNWSFTAIA